MSRPAAAPEGCTVARGPRASARRDWLTGGPLQSLGQIADVVRSKKRARVASWIISVDRFGADEVSALYAGP